MLSVFLVFVIGTLIANFYKILKSRWVIRETQTEEVDFRYLSAQVFGILAFSAVWWLYAYQGNLPILTPMAQVNEEFMKLQETTPEENGPYLFAHMLLYCFTIVQATMWI